MFDARARGLAGLFAAAAIGWLLPSHTALGATVNFTATIDGTQEVPSNGSTASASGTFTMDTVANTLSYNIVIAVPPPSGEVFSHIHGFAGPGVNAAVLHSLPNGSPKIGVWNFTEPQQANIIAGLTYANIHSNAFLNGEIRGQINRVPTCGDTVVDGPGEQCDDGNNTSGDGCDALCQSEAPNHYLCRQVKDLKVPIKFQAIPGLSLVDQTGIDVCEAKKPYLICDPADKNGGGVPNPSLHYCCYKLKCGQKPAVNYEVTDQFWNGTLQTKKPKFLCNPCSSAPAP